MITMNALGLGIDRETVRSSVRLLRSDLPSAFLALLTLALPLVRVAQLEDSFLTPKLALLEWFLLPTIAALLVRVLRSTESQPALPWHSRFLILFVAWGACSLFYARSAALSQFALSYFVTFLCLHIAAFFAIRTVRQGWVLLACGMAAASLTALWTLAEDFTHGSIFGRVVPRLPDWRGYLAAGLGNSGHIAGFIGLFYPAAILALLATPSFPWLLVALIFFMTAALIVTWSVGSTGALLASLLFCAGVCLHPTVRPTLHWRRLWWVVAASVACKAFYFLPHPANPHAPSLLAEAFNSQRWVEGWPTRVAIWKTTWHMILHHPWLGIGLGNFTLEYVRQIVPSVIGDPHLRLYAGAFTNDAHNEYLHVWAEGGLVALTLYLAIFVSFFMRAHRLFWSAETPATRLLALASVAGVMVFALDSLMTFPLRLPSHIAVWALLLAIPEAVAREAASATAGQSSPSVHQATRPQSAALLAVLLLLLALSALVVGRRLVAEAYFKHGRVLAEQALPMPDGSLVSPWHAAEQIFTRGLESLRQGDEKAAERFFAAAHEILQREPFNEVELVWRKALEWDPRYSNASSRYGAFLLMRGSYAEAQRFLNQALLDLEAFEVHERAGWAAYFLGDKRKAAEHWDLCRQRRPLYADYYRDLIGLTDR